MSSKKHTAVKSAHKTTGKASEVGSGPVAAAHPLASVAGIFADDLTWAEVQQAIRDYRAEVNADFE